MNQPPVSTTVRALAGLLAGMIAGAVFGLLSSQPFAFELNLIGGGALGSIFGLVFGPRVRTLGGGLVWGEAFGIARWLVGPLTVVPLLSGHGPAWTVSEARAVVPLLLGYVASYGAVLGLGYFLLVSGLGRLLGAGAQRRREPSLPRVPTAQDFVPALVQASIVGGVGGLLGSWIFLRGIDAAEFFPLLAGLMGSESTAVGRVLHCAIGTLIGVSFGLLFHRDVHGAGSGLVWGINYGLFWWILGPLTLMPWLLGMSGQPDWSLSAARSAFPALVAHMLYGALVGLFYALANRMWRLLFVDSDPLNRSLEGAGTRGLRGVLMGQAAGIVGGLLFTIVMVGIGALPRVASLIRAESTIAGFLVHLTIAIIVGSSYGLLFQREAFSYGSGLAWGLVYGLVWWLLGALTLFPILLRQPVDWSPESVGMLYPSLVGHLLYGAGLGVFFQFLARRYDAELSGRLRLGCQGTRIAHPSRCVPKRRCAGTPASSLWAVTLLLGVMLPLLLL